MSSSVESSNAPATSSPATNYVPVSVDQLNTVVQQAMAQQGAAFAAQQQHLLQMMEQPILFSQDQFGHPRT